MTHDPAPRRPAGEDRPRIRGAVVVLAAVLAAVAAFPLGLRLAGPSRHDLGLGRVTVDVRPSAGGALVGYVPIADWGVRVDPFLAPFSVRVEPRSLDRQELLRVAAGRTDATTRAREAATDAVHAAVLRSMLWWIACAALLGGAAALALRAAGRPARPLAAIPLAAAAAAALGAAGAIALAQATFDETAFRTPEYFAYGGELPQILRYAQGADRLGAAYRGEVERGLREFATVLSAVQDGRSPDAVPAPAGDRADQALLLSDLHANVLALPTLGRFAGSDLVFAPGDFGQEGGSGEVALLAGRVSRLGGRMVAVSGNHDSRRLMLALARRGVLVLTERGRLEPDGRVRAPAVRRVGDLLVAGAADPFEAQSAQRGRPLSFDALDDGEALRTATVDRLTGWIEDLDPQPDVVLIHQSSLATAVAERLTRLRRPLLLLAGHDHRQRVLRYGNRVVLDAGSAGAGGVFGVGRESIGLARIIFRGTNATAVDMISIQPIGGGARAQRIPLAAGGCTPQGERAACVYLDG